MLLSTVEALRIRDGAVRAAVVACKLGAFGYFTLGGRIDAPTRWRFATVESSTVCAAPHATRRRRSSRRYWMSRPAASEARCAPTRSAESAALSASAGDGPHQSATCAEYTAVMTPKSAASARQ